MDKSEFYLNQPINHECFKLPGRDKKYLLKENFLSEFFSEDEKAEARFNLGITPLLNELKALITSRPVDDSGNVRFGLEPTNGEEHEEAYSEVLSSAVIYNTLLKYYTKEEIDGWIQNIEERLTALSAVDEDLDEDSVNPVQNKTITRTIGNLQDSYNRLANNKVDKEELLNYNTIDETTDLLNELRDSLIDYIGTVEGHVDLSNYFTKDEINTLLNSDYVTKESMQSIEESVEQINDLSEQFNEIEEDIQNVKNFGENIQDIQEDIDSIQEDIDEIKNGPKHVFLTQSQYESLESYENNTLYFTFEDSEGSHFGDEFPLTLG